jgi:CheY-like chemotaxis protein
MSFEETTEELANNFASLGFDLAALEKRQLLALDFVYIERTETEETGEYNLEGLFIRLGYALDSVGAKQVVLDTVEALFAGFPNELILRSELRRQRHNLPIGLLRRRRLPPGRALPLPGLGGIPDQISRNMRSTMLADDHVMFRKGVKRIIEETPALEVVAEANDGLELLRLLPAQEPKLVLLDISMPHLRGLETIREIKKLYPRVKIIFLTMHRSKEFLHHFRFLIQQIGALTKLHETAWALASNW